jgi:outer membrane protein assembly factor BamE
VHRGGGKAGIALPLQWADHIATIRPMSAYSRFRTSMMGLSVLACAALAGCGSVNNAATRVVGLITPYKIDVVQGNFVSKEQVEALKPGMDRAQVREVLGTPLLASVFHADRWDYVFTFKRQGVEPQSRKLTVFFKGDALERFEGDDMPSEADFVAQLDVARKSRKVPVLEASEETLKQYPAPTVKAPSAEATPPPVAPLPASYPPLEPTSR